MLFDDLLRKLETEVETALKSAVAGLVATARIRLEGALTEVAEERAKGLAEVAKERAELMCEIQAMHKHKEAQEGRVELNIGGYRFETSVQALRRIPHTFFDAYFSGRYEQDVCDDGSIFVDRDGEHFGHVLEYMRDGVVSVADPEARPSMSMLRALKREFGFYCIELVVEPEPEQTETAYVMGGDGRRGNFPSMERYEASSGQWSAAAAMSMGRSDFGCCVIEGELYVMGGQDNETKLSGVEKYTPSSDTWSAMVPLPAARARHAAVAMGSVMYVLGGELSDDEGGSRVTASVLRFDSTQGTWSEVAPMPAARHAFAACAVGSDVYIFGGYAGREQASVFKYDTVANAWSTLAPMSHACCDFSACVLDGLIYLVGAGGGGRDVIGREVLCFDPASEVWRTLAPLSSRRDSCALFVLAGCLYVVGGLLYTSIVERYDVASNIWREAANLLEARRGPCAVTIVSAGPAEEHNLFDSLIVKAASRR
jgi:hypothetical protein